MQAHPVPVRVAAVGPLTGPRASWGKLLTEAAAALAHTPVQWEFLDDRGDPGEAVARASEVVSDGGFAAVVGHFSSQGARGALPLYQAARLPALLPLATAPRLTDGMHDTALRLCSDDTGQAAAIAAACRERGQRHLTVVSDGSDYGAELGALLLTTGGPELSVQVSPEPPDPSVAGAVALCGVHHWAARMLRRWQPGQGRVVLVCDDCDVADFASQAGPSAGQVLVARLAGGTRSLVALAFAALAGTLAKYPGYRGRELLDAIRAELAGIPMPLGWEIAPVLSRPGRRSGGRQAGAVAAGRCDVLVVGGGMVGLGTAAELADAGADVLLLDDGARRLAASTMSGALVLAFEPTAPERDLALDSFLRLWGRPEQAAAYGMRRTGGIVLLGAGDLDAAGIGVGELRSAGVACHLLEVSDIARRWPGLNTDDLAGAVWEPGAGYALATVALATLQDRAARAGTRIIRPGRLARLPATDSVAAVQGPRGAARCELHTRVFLVAAGCGSPDLLGQRWPHDRIARTRRIRYGIFAGGHGLPALVDLTTGIWGRPAGQGGYLVGRPVAEWDSPPAAGTAMTGKQVSWIRSGAGLRLPFLVSAPFLSGCFGTDLYVTGGAVLGPLPGTPHTVVAAGWSGGGFKAAPGAARRAAKAAAALLALGVAHEKQPPGSRR
jgi:glycine/D-amino acid oxidase-like deaminating enzyme